MSEFKNEIHDDLEMGDGSGGGVPPGTYFGTFSGRAPATTSRGETVKWAWTVCEGEHKSMIATCFIDRVDANGRVAKPSPNNKLGRVLNGLAGRTLAAGEKFNPNSVIGQKFMIVVTTGKDGKGTRVDSVASLPK
jgi:hypothetical protein